MSLGAVLLIVAKRTKIVSDCFTFRQTDFAQNLQKIKMTQKLTMMVVPTPSTFSSKLLKVGEFLKSNHLLSYSALQTKH